jgi:UDP-N-acetyl-D-mannosaminuronate dehydrogenase
VVKNDPELHKLHNIILSSNLTSALKGTDLIMIVADHAEYRSLTPDLTGGVPIYDGRGILDKTIFDHTTYASIGIGSGNKT